MDVGHGVVVRVQPFRIGLIAGNGGKELGSEFHARVRKLGGQLVPVTEECRGL